MLFQKCTKLTFGLSDVFVVTVIARNRINGVGSLFFRDRILRFGKNMPQVCKQNLYAFLNLSTTASLWSVSSGNLKFPPPPHDSCAFRLQSKEHHSALTILESLKLNETLLTISKLN